MPLQPCIRSAIKRMISSFSIFREEGTKTLTPTSSGEDIDDFSIRYTISRPDQQTKATYLLIKFFHANKPYLQTFYGKVKRHSIRLFYGRVSQAQRYIAYHKGLGRGRGGYYRNWGALFRSRCGRSYHSGKQQAGSG